MQAYNPRQTPEGDYSLPFGDNVRLKQRGNVTFIGYHEPEKSGPVIDTEKIIANGPASSYITK
jgi:hypothetical protein